MFSCLALNGDCNARAAQDMAGIAETDLNIWLDSNRLAILNSLACRDRIVDILVVEQTTGAAATAVSELAFVFMNTSRVGEHDSYQIAGRVGAVDRTSKPASNQIGEVAAVVRMSVAQKYSIDRSWIKWENRIARSPFVAPPHFYSTIQQESRRTRFDQMH